MASWTCWMEMALLHLTNFPAVPMSLTEIHEGTRVHS